MGLDLVVGMRALIEDDEGRAVFDEDLQIFNRTLNAVGLPSHVEQEAPAEESFTCQMWGYGGLHDLRRLAAHIQAGLDPKPFAPTFEATNDPVLGELYRLWESASFENGVGRLRSREVGQQFDHLIFHGDADGMYLPIDFDDVVLGTFERDGMGFAIGSSHALARECEALAEWLDLPLSLDLETPQMWSAAESPPKTGPKWQQFGVESFGCLRLHRASRHSIDRGMALVFA